VRKTRKKPDARSEKIDLFALNFNKLFDLSRKKTLSPANAAVTFDLDHPVPPSSRDDCLADPVP
jgi:hypothetical protein